MPHETLYVERQDGRYVGRCDCGWTTSAAAPTGAALGAEWDVHRSQHVGSVTDATG